MKLTFQIKQLNTAKSRTNDVSKTTTKTTNQQQQQNTEKDTQSDS